MRSKITLTLLVLLGLVLAAGPGGGGAVLGAPLSTSGIRGQVFDGSALLTEARASTVIPNGLPTVAGATVRVRGLKQDTAVPALDLEATAGIDGSFAFDSIMVAEPYLKVSVDVSAPGFGTWQVDGAPIRPNGNVLELYVELLPYPQSISYTPPEEQPPRPEPQPSASEPPSGLKEGDGDVLGGWSGALGTSEPMVLNVTAGSPPSGVRQYLSAARAIRRGAQSPASPALSECSGYFSNDSPPPTIRVWRRWAGETFVRTYNFKFYVKHVLASEWIPSWHQNSLQAGSVAVENYGWYWVNNWRGWHVGVPASGECYDVDDSDFYQVFNPNVEYPSTSSAVDAVWPVVVKKSGAIFEASYRDTLTGSTSEACGAGTNGLIMSQWGTKTCADGGMNWRDIVTTYYYPGVTFSEGKDDKAVWRPANNSGYPSNYGVWYVLGEEVHVQWGLDGDIPVAADYDGDGRDDRAVWRPGNVPGEPANYGFWYVYGTPGKTQWGLTGDIPVPGDYNGDGKDEFAVWRPGNDPGEPANYGFWYVYGSPPKTQWGLTGDMPVPADYNGDAKDEFAVWRPGNDPGEPANYGFWYVYGSPPKTQWGLTGDLPVPADYNDDGTEDKAVWRPGNVPGYPANYGFWYIYGTPGKTQWGLTGDIPVPAHYDYEP